MATLRQALKKSKWENFKEIAGDNCNYETWNVTNLINDFLDDLWIDKECDHDDNYTYIIDCFGNELIEDILPKSN